MTQINPLAETLRHLVDRQVMPKPEFLDLPDEARMRAFTIARQTETAILTDTLKALEQHVKEGGTLWTFKEKFPEILAPYREAGREWHLNLVVQQNARQALAVGAYQQRQRVKRAFPYVEYQTGINPRPTHAALDGKIFLVDDPFLHTHTPPWEHGCNCDLIPRTAAQVGRIAEEDQGRPLDEQEVVPGNAKLEQMVGQNKLPDATGGIHPIDVRPANEKPDGDDYSFRPDRLNQNIDLSTYSPELRQRLAGQLQQVGYEVSADGLKAVAGPFPTPPTAMKRVGPVMASRIAAPASKSIGGRIAAFKAAPIAAVGAQGQDRRHGRHIGRVSSPAPQIACKRVASPKPRRVA